MAKTYQVSFAHGGSRKRDANNRKPSAKPEHAGKHGGGSKSGEKMREHPLAEEFSQTLEESTAALTTRLLEEITNAHRACLSRIVEVTARSQSYIDVADSATNKFARLSILTDDFDKELAACRVFVAAKQRNIDGLCGEYQAITNEIKELQREALAISPTETLTQQHSLGYKELEEVDVDADVTGEAHLEDAVGKFREIETKWVERMHNNEKKFVDEARKKRATIVRTMM